MDSRLQAGGPQLEDNQEVERRRRHGLGQASVAPSVCLPELNWPAGLHFSAVPRFLEAPTLRKPRTESGTARDHRTA
jgi:hypothetical protein